VPSLDTYHRQRLEKLLLALPEFDSQASRRLLLRPIFYNHALWDGLKHEGSPAQAAGNLLDLCSKDGESLCLLLTGLRRARASHPAHCAELDALSATLCTGTARRRRQPWTQGAPFRGLNYFDREHAPIFFGRDAELRDLIRTLTTPQGQRFTVIVGASGAGKSSLVRAGLWASLADGAVAEFPDSQRWLITAMKPGDSRHSFFDSLHNSLLHSLEKHEGTGGRLDAGWRKLLDAIESTLLADLAQRLLTETGIPRWLLILDQMEELFAPDKAPEGAAFLDRLLEATAAQPSPLQVVATLRADFFHHCLNHPPLKRAVFREGGQFPLARPDRISLEQMIRGPLTELELPEPWILDPGLPPRIAADAEGHNGGLALMSFALRELYDRCSSTSTMDCATYASESFGGLRGAVARRADTTLQSLGENADKTLHLVFARLVRVSDDDAPVRQREFLSAWDNDTDARQLVEAFVSARLLVNDRATDDQPIVEVAHEALLTEWPTLSDWINQRRDAFRLASRVRAEAKAWAGSYLAQQHRRPWPSDLIDHYRERLDNAGFLDSLLGDKHVAKLLTPEFDWLTAELNIPHTTPRRRWEIGLRFNEIGDKRPGVGVRNGVPDILWQTIPGGKVQLEEIGTKTINAFRIATYPITAAQFRAFLDAPDDYDNQELWKGLRREDPDPTWRKALANHPITFVSWHDATAFCRWLRKRLGEEIRLPHEAEWQWAAQSAQPEFTYAWGPQWLDGHANTAESGIGRTTAVGMYPEGCSRQGVADLAGNVWEWCSNRHEKGTGKSDERRVLRGGSWSGRRSHARAGSRDFDHPYFRYSGLGFRVVCSAPIHTER
jgi:hypothetical protein